MSLRQCWRRNHSRSVSQSRGWVTEIRARLAGCAHHLERSALGFIIVPSAARRDRYGLCVARGSGMNLVALTTTTTIAMVNSTTQADRTVDVLSQTVSD